MPVTGVTLRRLAGVVPRSMLALVKAARRPKGHAVPALRVGPKQVGEALFDELLVAAEALRRDSPEPEAVRRDVAATMAAARGLRRTSAKAVLGAPVAFVPTAHRTARIGGLAFEELSYVSDPVLPRALRAFGGAHPSVVRVLQHEETRPWVVWLHGAEMGRASDLVVFRARRLHERLGFNVAFPVLPRHHLRAGDAYPGLVPLMNVAATLRAVQDVAAVVRWASSSGQPVSLVGVSLGGLVASLTAAVEPAVSRVAAIVPMVGIHETIAHHLDATGGAGRELAALLRSDAVRAVDRLVDPVALTPHAAPGARLVVGAVNDRMAWSAGASALHESWQGRIHWYHGGHVGPLFNKGVRDVVEEFLGDRAHLRRLPA